MPRRISDYPDAFTGWNFISSIGSIISVAATALFLHIVYLQLVKGKAIFGYPWAVPQLFSDYLRILKDRTAPGLEWALHNPPKPHAFTSLPLQSTNPVNGPRVAIPSSITPYEYARFHDLRKRHVDQELTEQEYDFMFNYLRKLKNIATTDNAHPNASSSQIAINRQVLEDMSVLESELLRQVRYFKPNYNISYNFLPFIVGGSLYDLPFIGYILRAFVYSFVAMIEISLLPYVIPTLEPIITAYRLYKLPSRVLKMWSLLVRIYNYVMNSKKISSSILVLAVLLVIYYLNADFIYCDAPRAWGLYFQDSASPQMEALVELHDNIMYYLVAILFAVGWIQGAIIRNFDSSRSPISNKYLNHGTLIELIWTITPIY
jgi:hypothetical protein